MPSRCDLRGGGVAACRLVFTAFDRVYVYGTPATSKNTRNRRREAAKPQGPAFASSGEAYSCPGTLTDEEILERLVALNHECAAEEAAGKIR